MKIWAEYTVSAAHSLPLTPEDHKCRKVHGHNFSVVLFFEGEMNENTGWVFDYAKIDEAWFQNIHPKIDHQYLNEIPGLMNPTSEVLCRWIWNEVKQIKSISAFLSEVQVKETNRLGCSYHGE